MQLRPARALTPLVVALRVGFDAILVVNMLYDYGISVNLAQQCLDFDVYDGLIVPMVATIRDSSMPEPLRMMWRCTAERALVRFSCKRPGRRIGPPRATEGYLIAAWKDQKWGLVVPEQLITGLIEIQSTVDYDLYLPAGSQVAKMRDCHFVPHGLPRFVSRHHRILVNVGLGGRPVPRSSAC